MRVFILLLSAVIVGFSSCKKEKEEQSLILEDHLCEQPDLERSTLIACAGGNENGLDGEGNYTTTVFFYPEPGAHNFKYYEAGSVSDSINYSAYIIKDLAILPIFNGYMYKIDLPTFLGEKMSIITYETNGKIHICDPIRLKTNTKPTEVSEELVTVIENGINPTFNWTDGKIDENVIFFQVISNPSAELISGTYTFDTSFTFYDLSNVVLNISPTEPEPSLNTNSAYRLTLMGVSEDNWINMFSVVSFNTSD